MTDEGYIDYFEVLDVPRTCKSGDARKNYKKKVKALLMEIGAEVSNRSMTEAKFNEYLRKKAALNAAVYILRDNDRRAQYLADREEVMQLEDEWRQASGADSESRDRLRQQFDGKLRDFLAKYMEEYMLEAGRDPECVEASEWNLMHERHGTSVLRHYRQRLYRQIHERLPYSAITPPRIEPAERDRFAQHALDAGAA